MTAASRQINNPRTIESSEFKAEHLDMLKKAADTGAEIKVTENGGTLLNLTVTQPDPAIIKPSKTQPAFGKYRHLLISYDDIISPIDEDWEEKFDKKWEEKLGTH